LERYKHGFNLSILNKDELRRKILEISQQALSHGMLFNSEIYAILFDKETNLGDLCLLDLGSGIITESDLEQLKTKFKHMPNKDAYVQQSRDNFIKSFLD
jgi:hypothetical protein